MHTIPQTVAGVNALLSRLMADHDLKNYASLARALRVAPPVISKLAHGAMPVGATLVVNIYDTFDMSVADIKATILGRPAA